MLWHPVIRNTSSCFNCPVFKLCCFQDALLAFREKLSEQLSMIEEAQLKKAGQLLNMESFVNNNNLFVPQAQPIPLRGATRATAGWWSTLNLQRELIMTTNKVISHYSIICKLQRYVYLLSDQMML